MSEAQKDDINSKVQNNYQRLADVALRTSATTLTILFAFTFAYARTVEMGYKIFIVGIGLILILSILFAIMCLYGIDTTEIRFIRLTSYISTFLMVSGMILAFLLLVVALFSVF